MELHKEEERGQGGHGATWNRGLSAGVPSSPKRTPRLNLPPGLVPTKHGAH